jgi:hypothetical protein
VPALGEQRPRLLEHRPHHVAAQRGEPVEEERVVVLALLLARALLAHALVVLVEHPAEAGAHVLHRFFLPPLRKRI